jgi:hypothetical protein
LLRHAFAAPANDICVKLQSWLQSVMDMEHDEDAAQRRVLAEGLIDALTIQIDPVQRSLEKSCAVLCALLQQCKAPLSHSER